MKPFKFIYEGQLQNALTDHYPGDGNELFHISYNDQSFFIRGVNDSPGNEVSWSQDLKKGEPVINDTLIEALGEGLQRTVNT